MSPRFDELITDFITVLNSLLLFNRVALPYVKDISMNTSYTSPILFAFLSWKEAVAKVSLEDVSIDNEYEF